MVYSAFGLTRRPFLLTPDADTYCSLETHEAALRSVVNALTHGDGIALMSGPVGIGKTILGVHLLESLPKETVRIMVNAMPAGRPVELLQAILFDLGLPYQGITPQEMRLAITAELHRSLAEGRRGVLLVDEAHHLTADALEEIRLLDNVETKTTKAICVVLLGLPVIRNLLSRPETAPVAQRVVHRAVLEPLGVEDSLKYVRHQIRACGGRPESVFTGEALDLLVENAAGIPRLLNCAAGLSLTLASSAEMEEVDAEAMLAALRQLELLPESRKLPIHAGGGGESQESERLTQAAGPDRPISSLPVTSPGRGKLSTAKASKGKVTPPRRKSA